MAMRPDGRGGMTARAGPAQLYNHGVDAVQILNVHSFRCDFLGDAIAVEEETIRTLLRPHA